MAGSANWVSFGDLAAEFEPDLCEEGVEYVAAAAGATTSTLIDSHGLMAGGTLKKGEDAGTPSISYLNFDALEAAIPGAYALCAG